MEPSGTNLMELFSESQVLSKIFADSYQEGLSLSLLADMHLETSTEQLIMLQKSQVHLRWFSNPLTQRKHQLICKFISLTDLGFLWECTTLMNQSTVLHTRAFSSPSKEITPFT